MKCWLEIDTGAGDLFEIFDFGGITVGQQTLLTLAGTPNLLIDLNGQKADTAGTACQNMISTLKANINSIATPKQSADLEPLLEFLDAIADKGPRNPACIFRCISGIPQ